MNVPTGTRVGFWRPGAVGGPFIELGFYDGPGLDDPIIGAPFTQQLMDGELRFCVGVLFRPELGRKNKFMETIIIITNYVEEMWDYETWLKSPSTSMQRS